MQEEKANFTFCTGQMKNLDEHTHTHTHTHTHAQLFSSISSAAGDQTALGQVRQLRLACSFEFAP